MIKLLQFPVLPFIALYRNCCSILGYNNVFSQILWLSLIIFYYLAYHKQHARHGFKFRANQTYFVYNETLERL